MTSDILAVASKEWQELLGLRGFRGKVGAGLFLLAFGVVLPLETGRAWITSPGVALAWSWVPMFLVSTVITDAIAGERERHTLETLLATRLPDNAILFGKIGAALGYAATMTLASVLLAEVTINAIVWREGIAIYRGAVFMAMCAFGAGGAVFVAAIGVLISLRAATVRQAQQLLGGAIVLLMVLPLVIGRLLPADWKHSALANAPSMSLLGYMAFGALIALDIAILLIAMARFRRHQLIAP